MAVEIPEAYHDLLEKPVVVSLGTVMPSGQPQVHPVWVDHENGRLIVNTARGRQKDKNLTARPQATILFVDPENPYRYLEVRGRVVEDREEGAREHIDRMALKYLGVKDYPYYQGEQRVLYFIEPEHTTSSG